MMLWDHLQKKIFLVQVIQHSRNRGVSAAGNESSHRQRLFPEEFFEFFRPIPVEPYVTSIDF